MILRCRFAPSPTGQLHVGGARTALFNYLLARKTGGRFVLRIEDTDQARSSQASEDAIKADMRWLGIVWNEGPDEGGPGAPYRQSKRRELYDQHLQQLLDSGHAYEAWETRDELDALREAGGREFMYRKRAVSDEDVARYKAEGRVPVLRLDVNGRSVTFDDGVVGEVTVEQIEDFVIRKADGFPTYHFAVVVDDHHMQVTQVLRAKEHLMNTAKHMLLYDAFGWDAPKHAHAPLIFSMGGGKMSKRDKAKAARAAAREAGLDDAAMSAKTGLDVDIHFRFRKKKTDDVDIAEAIAAALDVDLPEIDVRDFRKAGYLPEALRNFLALLGWSAGDDKELFTHDELIEAFSIERIGRSEARFDREKLRWMNGMYIRQSTIDRLHEVALEFIQNNPSSALVGVDESTLRALLKAYQPRIETMAQLETQAGFFLERPTAWGPAKAIKKHLLKGDGRDRLKLAGEILAACDDWTAEGVEAALQTAADAHYEGRIGKLAQPVRVAVAGGPVSPAIGETLALLGQDETLARIAACSAHHAEA